MLSRIILRSTSTPKYNFHFSPQLKQKLNAHFRLCRYDKPIGTLLLYYPCVWGTIIGQPIFDLTQILFYSGVFGVGAFTMRSAGCIVNDMWDKDFDSKVERTKSRPLATGELNMKEAWINLAINLTFSLGVLTQLSWPTIATSFAIVPVAFLYPLTKRYFKYPQLVLGISINWGIIVGALQTGAMLSPASIACYTAAVISTLTYDTIYAHQDLLYDKKLGLYSTAYTMSEKTPLYLTIPFSGFMLLTCYLANYSLITYPLILALQYKLYTEIQNINLKNPQECGKFFKNYKYYQLCLCLIFGLGSAFKNNNKIEEKINL